MTPPRSVTERRRWAVVALRALAARRSLVLGYHGVDRLPAALDPFNLCVDPAHFRRQVESLLGAGFRFCTVAELAERAGAEGPPTGFAALSFDDGMDNNHSIVRPILREYGIPATVYVTTGLIAQPNPWLAPTSGARMMTESELRDLATDGIELGAHSVSHLDLSRLDREACLREMLESKQALERVAGRPVRTFAYPSCRYGPDAVAAAREAGFVAAVACEGRGGWRRFEWHRAMLTGRDLPGAFFLKLADAYQPLFDSLPGRAVRVSTRRLRARRSRPAR